jgi:4-hydroxy-2-oxoheptanedioate aldolase
LSLGLPPILDREEPKIIEIYERVIRETAKRGLLAGMHTGSAAYAARVIGMGYRLVTIANDSGLMARAAAEAVQGVRKAAGDVAS